MVTRLRPIHRKVLRDLWHLRSQMLAVAAVMACGVAMFVTLRSMHGWLRDTQADYYARYRFADVFAHVRRAPANLAARLEAVPGVGAVQTRIVAEVTLDVPGLAEPATGRLVSIPDRRAPILNDLHIRTGRWVGEGADEVVVSEAFARANGLVPGDQLPAVINGRWQTLRIVGVALSPEYIYEIRGLGSVFPDNRRFGVLWMGYRGLAAAFRMEGAFNDVSLQLASGASEAGVIEALDRILAPYGSTGAYGREDHLSHNFVTSEIEETRVTSVMLPSIFLGVTAFLLHIVLARLVATQREQIAVLKAFGYTRGALAAHYVELAIGPVLVGAVTGTVLGIYLAEGLAGVYARFYQFPSAEFVPDWSVAGWALLVSAGAALLGAVSSVTRVVRLPPAEAMRPEAPPVFRPGPIERWGLQRWVPAAGRMVLRSLERRPVRTALAVLGISLATSTVVTGWWMFDAVDAIREIQFELVDRYDVLVAFEEPRSPAAAWALARLHGVRRVEPFRAASVRLEHGHARRRSGVIGLLPDAELQQMVDRNRVRRPIPPGGLLVSDILAEDLGIEVGDSVTVAVLEGKRPVQQIPVAAVVPDLLGTSVTMSLPAMHALLNEHGAVSGAFLRIDPLASDSLYRLLKRMPAVSGVVVRESVISGFEDTIAESFLISITIMVGFAVVIAAGIVYNGARVALSERGRELASLRVLGFTRREVTRLLLGEQFLLTAAGIPLGWLIGYGLAVLIAVRFESNLFRIPLVMREQAFVFGAVVVIGAMVLSGLAVRRRIRRLDLVAVLKTRE